MTADTLDAFPPNAHENHQCQQTDGVYRNGTTEKINGRLIVEGTQVIAFQYHGRNDLPPWFEACISWEWRCEAAFTHKAALTIQNKGEDFYYIVFVGDWIVYDPVAGKIGTCKNRNFTPYFTLVKRAVHMPENWFSSIEKEKEIARHRKERSVAIYHQNLCFETALNFVKLGYKIRRRSWPNKETHVVLYRLPEKGNNEPFRLSCLYWGASEQDLTSWPVKHEDLLTDDDWEATSYLEPFGEGWPDDHGEWE